MKTLDQWHAVPLPIASSNIRWNINEIGGEDRVFVATNSDGDAIMIALKWS
jgi:hypothetical protein